ncbi:MAG: hypothetical protein R6W73_04765 [Candidatus Saliniplasma sp.]
MDLKVVGLIVGLLLIIGGVFMMSFTQGVVGGETEDDEPTLTNEADGVTEEERPYFWPGVLGVVAGLAIITVSYIKG